MRLTWSVLLCLVGLGAADRVHAMSCLELGDRFSPHSPLEPSGPIVPVDAQPWRLQSCDAPPLADCALIKTDELGVLPEDPEDPAVVSIAVTVEQDGEEACERDEWPEEMRKAFVRRFVPATPLEPGARYGLRCEETYLTSEEWETWEPALLSVRVVDQPSAPPSEVTIADVHYTRGDDGGCCGGEGDRIELRIAGETPKYMAEGGYLEVVYADGYTLAVVEAEGDRFVLPPTREGLSITPVAANGARGTTREVAAGEIDGDLVYMPCAVTGRRSSGGVWLLVAFGWICARRRARRCA